MPDMTVNGASVRAIRTANKMSLGALGQVTGLPRGYLSELERGIKGARPETLNRIAAGLRASPSAIDVPDDLTAMQADISDLLELALFTPEEAARVLSGNTPGAVSAHWLHDQCRDGRIPFTKVGRRRMFSRQDIAEIVTACRVEPVNRAPKRRGR